MASTPKIKGTTFDTFKVGKRGAQLKKSSTTRMSVRDETDSALANMEGADPVLPQDFLTKAYFDANTATGDFKVASVRRTTTLAGGVAYQDVAFDTVDIENDDTVIEHDWATNPGTDRISVKETGLYMIGYDFEIQPTASPSALAGRVRVNDTTVIVNSETMVEEDTEITNFNKLFFVELTANDYVTVQVSTAAGDTIQIGANFFVARWAGLRGLKGDTGSGSTITVEDEGSPLAGGPHDTLNFKGNVIGTDEGAGTASVMIPKHYDAIVSTVAGEGDYTLPSAAFAAGHKRVWIRGGTYVETADVVLPDGGCLHGEGGVVLVMGSFQVKADGQARKKTAGTISVTNGSAVVTGASTAFDGAPSLVAGDFISIGADFYEISTVDGPTQVTLVNAWQGPTKSGLSYIAQGMFQEVSVKNVSLVNSTAATGALFIRGVLNSLFKTIGVVGSTLNISLEDCGNMGIIEVGSSGSASDGIKFSGCRSIGISNAHFYDNDTHGANVTGVGGGVSLKFINCEFTGNGSNGATVEGTATDVSFTGCGSKFNSGKGFNTEPSTIRCVIDGCEVQCNGGDGIDFDGSQNSISGGAIGQNGGVGIQAGDRGVIDGAHIHDNTGIGIQLDGDTRTSVVGCHISNNGSHGISFTDSSSDDIVIRANDIEGNGGYGINIGFASIERTILGGNTFSGNTSGAINDLGTGTLYDVASSGRLTNNNRLLKTNTSLPNANNGAQETGITVDASNNISGIQNLTTTGSTSFSGTISPASIGSNQNNYNPTGLSTATVLRLTSSGIFNITGLAGGAQGRIIVIHNIGANSIRFIGESTSSTAANRFINSFTLAASRTVTLIYDSTTSRWRRQAQPGGTGVSVRNYFLDADALDSPNSADWAINDFASIGADTNNSGLRVRLFDDTTEEGVGKTLPIPDGSTNVTLRFKSRAETTPAGTRTVGLKIYVREMPNNAAVTSWSAGTVLNDISIPTNENWQYDEQTITLSSLGLTAGRLMQFELTRVNPTAGTELTGDWTLNSLEVNFS